MMDDSSAEKGFDTNMQPYAGKWVAMTGDKVIGHGGTPDQALHAAQSSQYKEKLNIRFVPFIRDVVYPPILKDVQRVLAEHSDVFLVGGCIRNALVGIPAHDLDIIVQNDTIRTARLVAKELKAMLYVMDEDRNTVRLITMVDGEKFYLDFAEMRGKNLEDDLLHRDFTINAMAVSIQRPEELLDPLGGAEDLQNHLIRMCSPDSIIHDPVRILRGIRLAAQYNLRIHPTTREAMKQRGSLLAGVSPERKRDELMKMLDEHRAATAVRALDWLGVLPETLPELISLHGVEQSTPHTQNVWEHTLLAVQKLDGLYEVLCRPFTTDSAADFWLGLASVQLGRYREKFQEHFEKRFQNDRSRRSLLTLALLYHDTGKASTASVKGDGNVHFFGHEKVSADLIAERARAMNLSRDETDYLEKLAQHHMRIHQLSMAGEPPTRKAVYRLFRDLGDEGVDLVLLSLADLLAMYGPGMDQERWQNELDICRRLLDAWWAEHDTAVEPVRLVDGNELMQMYHLQPGVMVGDALEAIREAQVEGEIKTREDIPAFMGRWLGNKN
jgi:tRNA nucleotidyltransferase/poly(A) polymerase